LVNTERAAIPAAHVAAHTVTRRDVVVGLRRLGIARGDTEDTL
jgi:hypothetical protein